MSVRDPESTAIVSVGMFTNCCSPVVQPKLKPVPTDQDLYDNEYPQLTEVISLHYDSMSSDGGTGKGKGKQTKKSLHAKVVLVSKSGEYEDSVIYSNAENLYEDDYGHLITDYLKANPAKATPRIMRDVAELEDKPLEEVFPPALFPGSTKKCSQAETKDSKPQCVTPERKVCQAAKKITAGFKQAEVCTPSARRDCLTDVASLRYRISNTFLCCTFSQSDKSYYFDEGYCLHESQCMGGSACPNNGKYPKVRGQNHRGWACPDFLTGRCDCGCCYCSTCFADMNANIARASRRGRTSRQ